MHYPNSLVKNGVQQLEQVNIYFYFRKQIKKNVTENLPRATVFDVEI
jgi:hypothetical protein